MAGSSFAVLANAEFLLFFGGMIAIGAVGMFVIVIIHFRRIQSVFKTVSERFAGTYYATGWFGYPKVRINRGSATYFIQAGNFGRKNKRRLHISTLWPDAQFRLSLTPETFTSRFKKLIGLKDTQVGDPEFDKAFIVQSNIENTLTAALNDSARIELVKLLRIGNRNSFDFQILAGEVCWQKLVDLANQSLILKMVEQFVTTMDALLPGQTDIEKPVSSDEIVWLPKKPLKRGLITTLVFKEDRLPICLVCGSEINEQRVECRSCRTAHHRECWHYFGMCSTYACGEKKFRR